MTRRRILFVSTSTTRGGAEKILYTLITHLNREKFEVLGLVSLKSPGVYASLLQEKNIPIESLEIEHRGIFSAATHLKNIIREKSPEIVLAFMYQAIQLCRLVKLTSPAAFKLISSHRVNPRTRSFSTLLVDRILKSQDNLTVAECAASASFLINRQSYPGSKVQVIHNGIAIPPHQEEKAALRKKLGIPGDSFLIGTAGRLHAQKNHAALIDAVGILKDRKNLRCVIFGEGPERAEIESQIGELGLKDRVLLAGERENAASFFPALDAFILPSLWEGFPSVILEAMAAKTPVIATDVDGTPEMIEDGINGFLVPPNDVKALAHKIAELAATPENLRRQLVQNAYQTAREKFPLSKMIAAYEKVL